MDDKEIIVHEEDESRALDRPREFPLAPGGSYPYQEEDIDIRSYLDVIIRRKWIVITFFIAVVSTLTIATFMTKPLYEAWTTLEIDNGNTNVILFKNSFSLDKVNDEYYLTQCKLLRSRNLAERVIRKLRLDKNGEFTGRRKASSLVPVLQEKPALQPAIPPSLVDGFIGRLQVAPEAKTSLVRVGFISYDPKLAADVANAVAKSFIEMNVESKYSASQQARAWLENQLDIMKAKLERAEEKLNSYAAQNQIVFVGKQGTEDGENVIDSKLAALSQDLTSAVSDRISKEALYNEVKSGDPLSSSAVMADPLVQSLTSDLGSLESKYYQDLSIYKPQYPKMVDLKGRIERLKKRLNVEVGRVIASVKKDYQAAVRREDYLKDAFEKQKEEAMALNSRSVQYRILKREADTNRELYKGLLQRLKETGISAGMLASNIQVVDPAEVPRSPFKPNKKRDFMIALMIGLFGGVGLAFFAEYLDNTIKTPEDIEKKILMPSLALVPLCGAKEAGGTMGLLSDSGGNGRLGEAYSSLRTFLLFSSAGKPPKVMMVTSARRDEGKSTTAVNTAVSLTKSGAKVLLVDADMRKPVLHRIFRVKNNTGLSSFLSGNAEFSQELFKPTNVTNLYVLTSGPLPPNPAELLGSYRLRELIDGLYTLFDYIVIDTPPVLGLADAVATSAQTEGVIMVVRAGKTPREAARQASRMLESVNAKLLGVVLNAVSESHLGYGGYSYYGYGSKSYGGNEDK